MICCLILVYIVLKYLQLCLLTFFKATVYLYGRVGYIKDKIGYIKDKRIKNFQFIGPKTKLGNQRFKNVFPSNSTCLSFDWWLSGLQESTEGLGPSQRFPYYLAMALHDYRPNILTATVLEEQFDSEFVLEIIYFRKNICLLSHVFCAPAWIIDLMLRQSGQKTCFFSPVLTNQICVGNSNSPLKYRQQFESGNLCLRISPKSFKARFNQVSICLCLSHFCLLCRCCVSPTEQLLLRQENVSVKDRQKLLVQIWLYQILQLKLRFLM